MLVLLLSPALAMAESAAVGAGRTTQITARFATVEEGRQQMRDRTLFHAQITESMLPFYLQKKGGNVGGVYRVFRGAGHGVYPGGEAAGDRCDGLAAG